MSQREEQSSSSDGDGDGWATVPSGKGGRSINGLQKSSSDEWSGVPLLVDDIPQDDLSSEFQPCLLLLSGLPGSGKTTFARTLVEAMPYKVSDDVADGVIERRLYSFSMLVLISICLCHASTVSCTLSFSLLESTKMK
jgi:hypothetical protein